MAGRRCRSFTQPHHRRTRRAPYGRPATPPIIQRVVGGRMNRRICIALIAPVLMIVHPALALERPAPPQVLFEDLYADVELERVFADSKEFADATPKSPPADILALYHAQKPNSP